MVMMMMMMIIIIIMYSWSTASSHIHLQNYTALEGVNTRSDVTQTCGKNDNRAETGGNLLKAYYNKKTTSPFLSQRK
jgi:hypothetical protein